MLCKIERRVQVPPLHGIIEKMRPMHLLTMVNVQVLGESPEAIVRACGLPERLLNSSCVKGEFGSPLGTQPSTATFPNPQVPISAWES